MCGPLHSCIFPLRVRTICKKNRLGSLRLLAPVNRRVLSQSSAHKVAVFGFKDIPPSPAKDTGTRGM